MIAVQAFFFSGVGILLLRKVWLAVNSVLSVNSHAPFFHPYFHFKRLRSEFREHPRRLRKCLFDYCKFSFESNVQVRNMMVQAILQTAYLVLFQGGIWQLK